MFEHTFKVRKPVNHLLAEQPDLFERLNVFAFVLKPEENRFIRQLH